MNAHKEQSNPKLSRKQFKAAKKQAQPSLYPQPAPSRIIFASNTAPQLKPPSQPADNQKSEQLFPAPLVRVLVRLSVHAEVNAGAPEAMQSANLIVAIPADNTVSQLLSKVEQEFALHQ